MLPKRSPRAQVGGERPKMRISASWQAFLIGLSILLDALKAFFASFLITGSLLLGAGSVALLSSSDWTSWLPDAAKTAIGTAVTVGAAGTVGPYLEAFGIVLAMAIGLAGWALLITLLYASGVRFFTGSGRNLLMTFAGFCASEVPIVDALPTFTPTVYLLIRETRKEDRKAIAAWDEAEKARQLETEEAERMLAEQEALQYEATEAAARAEEADREEAEEEDLEAADDAYAAANDNEEIPEAARYAA